jgi:hypothetical protein
MKNIILQHYDGELGELEKLSIANIQKYAKYIGVEYRFIEGKPFHPELSPPCQKVYLLNEIFDDYETVIMLDIDMFTTSETKENIFDYTGYGLHQEIPQTRLHKQAVRQHPTLASLKSPYWGGAVYKFPLEMRKKLRKGLAGDTSWMYKFSPKRKFLVDEGIIHVLAAKAKIPITENSYIDPIWCQGHYISELKKEGFIHIRNKIGPNGPSIDKILNYQEMIKRGFIKE